MSNETEKKVILKSSDGVCFEVDEVVVVQSQALKHMIQDCCFDSGIPIPNVTSYILAKIIEYCKKHADSGKSEHYICDLAIVDDDLQAWDAEFIKVDQDTLFDLMMAADYLDIKDLLTLTCKTVANMLKGKTPEEMRETFNIKNDYTPEEEEEVRRENAWAFI